MNKSIINLLKKNGIIKREEDFQIFELANTNPFKNNIVGIFSKIKNKSYIIKECTYKEIANLKLANKLLLQNKIRNIKVLMPIDNIKTLFLFEDAGVPLNKKYLVNPDLLFEDIVDINNFFLQNGYFWRGLALRNIFYSSNGYTLIDFEKLFKIEKSNLNQRHLLFLELNLIQSFEEKLVSSYIDFLKGEYRSSNKTRKMDRVENVGWKTLSLKNRDEFLSYFDKVTINAEKPLNKDTRPFKIGHIIDELVSAEISFLWTLLMNERRRQGVENFKQLLDIASKIIELRSEEKAKFHLAGLIIALGNVKKYKETIKEIETAKRYCSTEKYDDIMKGIIRSVCKLVNLNFKNINIIARGSYGECVLTNKSDLDFEIIKLENDKIYSMISVEELVCEILSYFEIDAEGTSGRPTEKDIIINGESRDLFEIFELRLVSGNKPVFLKYLKGYKELVYKSALWRNKTEYENKNRVLSLKSIFEDTRFLITRLALMNNKNIVSPKVSEKIKICPKNIRKELGNIMRKVTHMRNMGLEDVGKYQILIDTMNQIKIKYELPICDLAINNEEKS